MFTDNDIFVPLIEAFILHSIHSIPLTLTFVMDVIKQVTRPTMDQSHHHGHSLNTSGSLVGLRGSHTSMNDLPRGSLMYWPCIGFPKADRQLFKPTVPHFKTGQTHIFQGDPISIKRDQAEIVDLSSDIYNRPS